MVTKRNNLKYKKSRKTMKRGSNKKTMKRGSNHKTMKRGGGYKPRGGRKKRGANRFMMSLYYKRVPGMNPQSEIANVYRGNKPLQQPSQQPQPTKGPEPTPIGIKPKEYYNVNTGEVRSVNNETPPEILRQLEEIRRREEEGRASNQKYGTSRIQKAQKAKKQYNAEMRQREIARA